MSKKNKAKFHKRIKAQLMQEMTQASTLPTKKDSTKIPQVAPVTQPTTPSPTAIVTKNTPPAEDESLTYIKKDLKKSAIIIGSIIILIIALSVLDNRTNILLKIGDRVFKVLNISS